MKMRWLLTVVCLAGCHADPPAGNAPQPEATAPAAAPNAAPAPSSSAAPAAALAVPAYVKAAVAATDRSDADRALDAGRHPAELLAFIGVKPGQKVAELGAGGGYTSELLARVVGPEGRVYAQNNRFVLDRFAAKPLAERLAKPVNANVVRADREFDDPLPPEAKNLDAVVIVLFYHDTVWQNADRARMNKAVFSALAPGGVYVIVDHSAKAGAGVAEAKTLHRIDESVVRSEVESAGFHFAASADFLRNPGDARDWNASPSAAGERRGTSDRFVLKFTRP